MWLQLIRAKYLRGCPLMACDRKAGSQFWRSIQAIKHLIRLGASLSIGDGRGTLFWLDPWLDGCTIRHEFPLLFAICANPMVLVADVSARGRWEVGLRRTLAPADAMAWEALLASLPRHRSLSSDSVTWSLTPSGCFSVGSTYRALFRRSLLPGRIHYGRPQCT